MADIREQDLALKTTIADTDWIRLVTPTGNHRMTVGQFKDLTDGIEYGSNPNGQYIRFPNGVQICWQLITRDGVAMTEAYGGSGLFREAGNVLWTYPASFVEVASASVFGNNNSPYAYVNGFYLSSITYRCATVVNTTRDGVPISFYAIGRWK